MHPSLQLLALSLLASPAIADFHIGLAHKWTNPVSKHPKLDWTHTIACPSNYLNCNCYGQIADNADRGVGANKRPEGDSFSLNDGLCGMGKLDFYYRSEKGHWEFYVSGGDGSLQGTCYSNSASDWCVRKGSLLSTDYTDKLVCYSYICGH